MRAGGAVPRHGRADFIDLVHEIDRRAAEVGCPKTARSARGIHVRVDPNAQRIIACAHIHGAKDQVRRARDKGARLSPGCSWSGATVHIDDKRSGSQHNPEFG